MTARYSTIAILACGMLLPVAGGAQSIDYAAFESLFGEPVTASVTGSPQRASDVPASMTIITAEEIRRSAARDIPGILSRLAGIDVQRTSSEHADVAVRGYNEAYSPRLLVLVDGRQVYADYYGFTPWSAIPVELDAIRQIEVVRGPSGALFGFNAVGGVVNIVTIDPLGDMPDSTVSVMAGSQALRQVSAVTTVGLERGGAIRLSAGARRAEEFSTPRAAGDVMPDSDSERNAVTVDARLPVGENSVLSFEGSFTSADQDDMPPIYRLSRSEYETNSFGAAWQSDTRFGLVKGRLYRNDIAVDDALPGAPEPYAFDNDVVVAQFEDIFKVGASHVVRVAGEYRNNGMETTPISGAKVHYDVLSLTAMSSWSVTSSITFTNAVRLDQWELGREGYLSPELIQAGVSNDDWDVSRDELSFNTGLVWETPDVGTFSLSAGRARQLPSLFLLGGFYTDEFPGIEIVGSPRLEPTNVTNVELAWTRQLEASGLRLHIGAFAGRTEDIAAVIGNVGSSDATGFEVSVDGRLGDRLVWDVNLLEQDVDDDLLAGVPFSQLYIDYENTTPERLLKGHVAWTGERFEIDGYLRYQSDTTGVRVVDSMTNAGILVPVPSHVAVDARLAYALSERLRLSLTGINLTRSAQQQTAAPAVERQVFATAEFRF